MAERVVIVKQDDFDELIRRFRDRGEKLGSALTWLDNYTADADQLARLRGLCDSIRDELKKEVTF